jgi:hypothetical protein
MDSNAVWNLLQTLIGTWEGEGSGRFPTIDDFRYLEVLEIGAGYDEPLLHYKQRTWKMSEEQESESHTETGFIGVSEDGTVEIASVQGLGRLEVLRGEVSVSDEGMSLDVKSAEVFLDERVLRSWRTIVFDTELLTYTMGMATNKVPEGAAHLAAKLTRVT